MCSLGITEKYQRSHEIHILFFRVVVHAIISISRMKFLVRRWKKTKKTVKKAWSEDVASASGRQESELSAAGDNRQTTEELEPDVNFGRK